MNTQSLTTSNTTLKEALRQFIMGELLLGQTTQLQDDAELLLSGLVDSLGAVRLITFIENELQLTIPPEDVVIENFQTINAMVDYIQDLRA